MRAGDEQTLFGLRRPAKCGNKQGHKFRKARTLKNYGVRAEYCSLGGPIGCTRCADEMLRGLDPAWLRYGAGLEKHKPGASRTRGRGSKAHAKRLT